MNLPVALIPYAVLLSFVAGGALWHLGDLRSQNGVATVSTGETVTLGGPFRLTDQNGTVRTERDFLGRHMLVFFGYTYCPDVCPTTLAVMAEALESMGPSAEKITPVMISVDPKRDTPETLKNYLGSFGPRFVGLTGSEEEVEAAAKAYRVYYRANAADERNDYTVDHSGVVYLMDPNGRFIANYSLQTAPEAMAQDLMRRLR